MNENKLAWKDTDWAEYLRCPVQKVTKYRKILQRLYFPCIKKDEQTQRYYFVIYERWALPNGRTSMTEAFKSDDSFHFYEDALWDANNNIIPNLRFSRENPILIRFQMPENASQMLRVQYTKVR